MTGRSCRTEALTLLQREERLQQIVKLVGPDVLPDEQKLILFVAEIIKDGFLAQSAFDENDAYCSPEKQVALLSIMLNLYHRGRDLIQEGVPLGDGPGNGVHLREIAGRNRRSATTNSTSSTDMEQEAQRRDETRWHNNT